MRLKKRLRLILPLLMCFMLVAGIQQKPELYAASASGVKAGEYVATEKGFGGSVEAKVKVDGNGRITALALAGEGETPGIGGVALEKLKDNIMNGQTVKVDAITGATITSNAVIAAVTAALKQAGVNTDAMSAATVNTSEETKETEIVIVGCGASGMAAALAAAESGAKVIVVEQTSTYGGTSLMGSEGFFAVESEQQKRAGWNETVDDLLKWFTDYTHNVSSAPLTRKFLEQTADTVEWVGKHGNPVTLMENTQKAHVNQIQTYHKFDNKKVGFANWYDKLMDMGVEIIFDTKVTELIQEDNGTVTGVIGTKQDGGKLIVNAKAAILATGGFLANAEMVEEYVGLAPGSYDMMTYGTTGEGIKMAMAAGADTYGLHGATYHGAMLPEGNSFAFAHFMMTPTLWIDGGGYRFCNEEVVYDFALWGNAVDSAGGSYWSVIDHATLEKFAKEGTPYTHSFMKTLLVDEGLDKSVFPSVVHAPENIAADPSIIENLERVCAEQDWAVKGNTIDELAENMGVPADVLKETIERYNDVVKNGKDDLFNKDKEYLLYDVSEGPFYALKPLILAEGTLGGISTNENLQVVRKDRSVIPGLYATGSNVGMIFGGSYPTLEGVNLSFAFNSGRIAAYDAVERIK